VFAALLSSTFRSRDVCDDVTLPIYNMVFMKSLILSEELRDGLEAEKDAAISGLHGGYLFSVAPRLLPSVIPHEDHIDVYC